MRWCCARAGAGLSLALGCLLTASPAWAQVKPATTDPNRPQRGQEKPAIEGGGRVHSIQIYNGSLRSVHYFTADLSRGDQGIMRDLERAENELSLADQLLGLRHQYVMDEAALEPQRRALQERLFAYSTTYATGIYPDEAIPVDLINSVAFPDQGFGRRGFGGIPFGYANYGNYPFQNGVPNPPANVAYSLEEGPLKAQLVRTLATQATPEYAAHARRDYDSALARAYSSEPLRAELFRKNEVLAAANETPMDVTVTMKSGKVQKGTLVREEPDQLVIRNADGEVEIRRDATETIARKPVKPAK